MNEIIERVANAIEQTMFAPHELPLAADLHERYLETARAAIEAMREPTPEMIEAWGTTPNIGMNWEIYARDKWRAMIQAALDEI